jgi:hypothetical protein
LRAPGPAVGVIGSLTPAGRRLTPQPPPATPLRATGDAPTENASASILIGMRTGPVRCRGHLVVTGLGGEPMRFLGVALPQPAGADQQLVTAGLCLRADYAAGASAG